MCQRSEASRSFEQPDWSEWSLQPFRADFKLDLAPESGALQL